jgi:hypothetical protein
VASPKEKIIKSEPKNDRSRNAKLDEDLLDVVLQVLGVEAPARLLAGGAAGGRVWRAAHRLNFYKNRLQMEHRSLKNVNSCWTAKITSYLEISGTNVIKLFGGRKLQNFIIS